MFIKLWETTYVNSYNIGSVYVKQNGLYVIVHDKTHVNYFETDEDAHEALKKLILALNRGSGKILV